MVAILPFERSKRWRIATLTAILLLGGMLRVIGIDRVPPAIHADEAPNAWNAYTLLKTGHDQDGNRWPIFYIRAFDDYRTAMYAYAIVPFQFIGGMNVLTTRLPAATFGVLSILLLYVVGARLFGVTTGIVAAAFLSVNPWHIQVSRWGHEASLTPFLVLGGIASLLWADLPVCVGSDKHNGDPRALRAALAGAVLGASCYGYASLRIFIPCFIAAIVLANWLGWLHCLSDRRGRLAVGAFVLSLAVVYLPLLWKQFTDPALFARARLLGYVWQTSDPVSTRLGLVIGRYFAHYGPDFLFLRGDLDPALSPPNGFALLQWYDLPLLGFGLMSLVGNAKKGECRILLIWLALYPVGDILFPHVSSHSLRSLPGAGCFALVSAVGAVAAAAWLGKLKTPGIRIAIGAVAAGLFLISSAAFLRSYFGKEFSRSKASLLVFACDILEASRWVAPRLSRADAMFVTGAATRIDSLVLFGLNYDPQKWFREPREQIRGPLPNGMFKDDEIYVRYGKVHFLLTQEVTATLRGLVQAAEPHRLIFIVRPGELGLQRLAKPVHEILDADGGVRLWVFDLNFAKGSVVSGQ